MRWRGSLHTKGYTQHARTKVGSLFLPIKFLSTNRKRVLFLPLLLSGSSKPATVEGQEEIFSTHFRFFLVFIYFKLEGLERLFA